MGPSTEVVRRSPAALSRGPRQTRKRYKAVRLCNEDNEKLRRTHLLQLRSCGVQVSRSTEIANRIRTGTSLERPQQRGSEQTGLHQTGGSSCSAAEGTSPDSSTSSRTSAFFIAMLQRNKAWMTSAYAAQPYLAQRLKRICQSCRCRTELLPLRLRQE